ncbi:MAG: MFS transporter, partial [Chthoniobacterales bacterium]
MTEAPSSGHALPPGSLNFNGFSFFNAVSFQIILGSPVILFAKSLGASSFILGVLVSLTPLLTILQLWAARFLHRTGYRNFVLAGWGSRTIFTLCIACLPLWPGISDRTRLAWLLVALFGFNSLRGFASGAWLPWLTALVPENVRGRFLSRDQAFMHTGCLVALLVSSWVMSGPVVEADYAIVFGIGAVAAVISLWFIRRIPEAQTQEQRRESAVLVPWRAMLAYKPFLRLLFFSMLY